MQIQCNYNNQDRSWITNKIEGGVKRRFTSKRNKKGARSVSLLQLHCTLRDHLLNNIAILYVLGIQFAILHRLLCYRTYMFTWKLNLCDYQSWSRHLKRHRHTELPCRQTSVSRNMFRFWCMLLASIHLQTCTYLRLKKFKNQFKSYLMYVHVYTHTHIYIFNLKMSIII